MDVLAGLQIPKIIYEADSKYNGHISVYQVGNTRKILVDKIYQSISHNSPSCNRLVWGKVVDVLKENHPEVKKLMILGLAGGTMAHLISKAFPGTEIVSVELDPVMVDISKKFFDTDSIPNHRIINDDAMRVVVENDVYDIPEFSLDSLIVDIYVGERFPDLGKSGNFVAALKRLVKPNGLIIFNRIYTQVHQDEVNTFIDYLNGFLHDVKCLVVAGYTNSDNVLIYGRP